MGCIGEGRQVILYSKGAGYLSLAGRIMSKIFISYRREDTEQVAARLGTRLKDDLRLENVFLDTQDIWAGERWREVLDQRLRQADAVVVLVGHRWAGPDGQRILDAEDVVRWEVRRAIDLACELVPVMVDGARWPARVPDDIAEITRESFVELGPAESRLGYLELLGNLFYKAVRREGDVIVVYDDTEASAEIHLRKLAGMLTSSALGEDVTPLIRAATRGFAAISLGEAAEQWPEVVVLRGDHAITSEVEARMRGVRGAGARVRVVPATAAGLLALMVSGTATRVNPLEAAPTLLPRPSGQEALDRAVRWSRPTGGRGWRVPRTAAVLAGSVATVAVVVGVVTLLPGTEGQPGSGGPSDPVPTASTAAPTSTAPTSAVPTSTVPPAQAGTVTTTVTVQVGGTGQPAASTVTSTARVTDTTTETVTDTTTATTTVTATQQVPVTSTQTSTVTTQAPPVTTTVTTGSTATRTETVTVTPKPVTVTVTPQPATVTTTETTTETTTVFALG